MRDHTEFDFDEIEIVNNRPMNVWLYALCRKYVADDDEAAENEAEVEPAYWCRQSTSVPPPYKMAFLLPLLRKTHRNSSFYHNPAKKIGHFPRR